MFCWHKWRPWTDIQHFYLTRTVDQSVIGRGVYQSRSCEKCGKKQIRATHAI